MSNNNGAMIPERYINSFANENDTQIKIAPVSIERSLQTFRHTIRSSALAEWIADSQSPQYAAARIEKNMEYLSVISAQLREVHENNIQFITASRTNAGNTFQGWGS